MTPHNTFRGPVGSDGTSLPPSDSALRDAGPRSFLSRESVSTCTGQFSDDAGLISPADSQVAGAGSRTFTSPGVVGGQGRDDSSLSRSSMAFGWCLFLFVAAIAALGVFA